MDVKAALEDIKDALTWVETRPTNGEAYEQSITHLLASIARNAPMNSVYRTRAEKAKDEEERIAG